MRPGCGYGASPNCVSVTFQLQLPVPATAVNDSFATVIGNAHRILFDILNHECSVLQAAMPGSCHITQLNFSSNVNERQESDDHMMNATASATYQLDGKADPGKK
jgi:hypothetical protein